jgi:hypothetical protein
LKESCLGLLLGIIPAFPRLGQKNRRKIHGVFRKIIANVTIVFFYCDSRAALAALVKITTKSSLAWECMQALERLSEFNRITLELISRYHGTPGNVEEDMLTKEGTIKIPPNQFTAIPFSVGKKTHQQAFGTG